MAGFTATEIIACSPEEVFTFMTDIRKSGHWIPGLISIDPLTRGPLRVGSQWSEIRRVGERENKTIVEVVEHQGPGEGKKPPYVYAGRSVHMGIEGAYHYRVEPEGEEASRVELTAIVRGANLFAGIFVPFAVKAMKKLDGSLLVRLKEAVESRQYHSDTLESLIIDLDTLDLDEEENKEDQPETVSVQEESTEPENLDSESTDDQENNPNDSDTTDEDAMEAAPLSPEQESTEYESESVRNDQELESEAISHIDEPPSSAQEVESQEAEATLSQISEEMTDPASPEDDADTESTKP